MQKGGRKLVRSGKHKGKYDAQVFRTERNKAAAKSRIARRKLEKPQPKEAYHRGRKLRRGAKRPAILTPAEAYERLLGGAQ